MEVKIIPCLKDNYSYVTQIFCGESSPKNVLIDAPNFHEVDNYLQKNSLKLDYILSTHHHGDHVDGNLELKNKYGCKIYGANDERIPGADFNLSPGEKFKIEDTEIETLFVPGHTSNHVAYYFRKEMILFSGDTLFSMGCGRLFEGTYEEMFESLQKIKALPLDTKIYCGHEYSEKNATFVMSIDPENQDVKDRYKEVLNLRERNLPTVPTTLALELKINPFLRASTVDEFKKLRDFRNTF